MPAQGQTKKDIQFRWYSQRSGITSTRLRDHMRAYYISQIGAGVTNKYLSDLQRRWLRLVITTNGGTPTGNYIADLWKQACTVKTVPIDTMVEENEINYYLYVSSANGL